MVERPLAKSRLSRHAPLRDHGVGNSLPVEALLRVGFALVLSPAQVVTLSPMMAFGVLILLISWTRRYMRAAKERRLRAGIH